MLSAVSLGRGLQLEGEGLDPEAAAPKMLLPRMKRLPAKRVVHLPRGAPDPLPFSLAFDAAHALPPGQDAHLLATFHVNGAAFLLPSGAFTWPACCQGLCARQFWAEPTPKAGQSRGPEH